MSSYEDAGSHEVKTTLSDDSHLIANRNPHIKDCISLLCLEILQRAMVVGVVQSRCNEPLCDLAEEKGDYSSLA